MPLGERIRQLRTEHGWSQYELATRVGSDARGISRYENNKITPCSCCAITDRTVSTAIAAGATTVEDIAGRCTAGGRCGGFWPALQRLLDQHDAGRVTEADHAAA